MIQLQSNLHYTQAKKKKKSQMKGFMFSEQNAEMVWTSVHIAKMELSGLREDEALSGVLLRAAGRAALLPASTQPAAIHSAVTLPNPPGILPILKRKKEICMGKKIDIKIHTKKKQIENTHLQKVINKSHKNPQA